MPVTLADLSKRSGYSLATISRVVNGVEGVSPAVQAEVERAISELGYVARRPRQNDVDAKTVEVILHRSSPLERVEIGPAGVAVGPITAAAPETLLTGPWRLSNDFYRHILDGILDELRRHGYKALLHIAHRLDEPALLASVGDGAAGVLLLGEGSAELPRFIAACRRPLVLVDILHDDGPDQVTTDNFAGVGQAVQHLLELGHRDLGFVGGADAPVPRERAEAFAFHAFRAGLRTPPEWMCLGDNHIEHVAATVTQLLCRRPRPTAIVCSNDYAALAVLRAAGHAGLRVPQDLSVTGFDDVELAALVTPALTTVRVATNAIGQQAVRQLLARRGTPAYGERGGTVRLPTSLMVRSSTAAPHA